jgi:cytoskeletal protein CcmA (bactofilin family)
VIGDIKAKVLTIEAGAIFVGKSTVGTPSQGSSDAETKPTQSVSSPSLPAMAGK